MRLALALGALALGGVTAGSVVVLHDIGWLLALGWAATLLTVVALPAGLVGRVPYALGWMGTLALAVTRTSGGSYLLGSTTSSYIVLGLGLLALSISIATFPLKRRRRLARDDEAPRDPDDLPR